MDFHALDPDAVQDLFAFFMEELHDDLCITDRQGIVRTVSSTWLKKHRVAEADVVGVSVARLEKLGIFKPSVTLAVLKEKKRVEMVQCNKNGEKILVSGVPIFDAHGSILWVVSYSAWDIENFQVLKEKYSEIKEQMERYSAEIRQLRTRNIKTPQIVAESPQMRDVLALLGKVAKEDIYLLITGETGVGKSLIAKFVHQMSRREKGPFIEINCGAIPENLLESELFGYEKGAFTGANREGKLGLIELADKGTLFLDEIGEMSHSLQVKLLRTIQERQITRVGGVTPIHVDFRLITATNRDLKQMIAENKFRSDLYFRISVVPLAIPPLRERPADLEAFIRYFIYQLNRKYNTKKVLSDEALCILRSYGWPGNVRELENVVEQMIVTASEDSLTAANIPSDLLLNADLGLDDAAGLTAAMERVESKIILSAYKKYKSTVGVSKALKISQPTAARKISKYLKQCKNE